MHASAANRGVCIGIVSFLCLVPSSAWAGYGAWVGPEDGSTEDHGGIVVASVSADHVTVTLSPRIVSDTGVATWIIPTPVFIEPDTVTFPASDAVIALDRASAPLLLGTSCETLYPGALPTPDDSGIDSDSKSLFGRANGRGPFGCLADRRTDPNPPWPAGFWDTGTVLDPLPPPVLSGAWDEDPVPATYQFESWDSNSVEAMIVDLVDRGFALSEPFQGDIRARASAGSAFLVASATWDPAAEPLLLSPIQFEVPSSAPALPIGFGPPPNAAAVLRFYVLNAANLGRASLIDGERRSIADDCMPPTTTTDFSGFVDTYVADTLSGADNAPARWTVEAALERGDCSPCEQGEPLDATSATDLGWTEPLEDLYLTRLRVSSGRPASEPALQQSQIIETKRLKFVRYATSLESDYPVCGQGFVETPGQCDEGPDLPGGDDTGTAAVTGWIGLVGLSALIRRIRR